MYGSLYSSLTQPYYISSMPKADVIQNLLQNEPLYRKVEIDIEYWHPKNIKDITFQFHCDKETGQRTFKLHSLMNDTILCYVETFKSETQLEYFHYFIGRCQSCSSYTVHFLLHVVSEGGEIHKELLEHSGQFSTAESEAHKLSLKHTGKIFMQKVGQWPSYQIKPDSTLYNFLKKENREYYNKALICLSQNYGIAAFAYLRKIVEGEIIHLVEELSKGAIANADKVKSLVEEFYAKRQMGPLIENVYHYLPGSLKALGDNPFKLLYSYLSEGIHNHTDDVCLSYAMAMNKLLEFTIKKIREEQNELTEIRSILGDLKSKGTGSK